MPLQASAQKAAAGPEREPDHGAVRVWLYAVAALVVAMIIVGGATRLTDSGLSITEWQPLLGAIPPLSDADWQEAFAKYQQIPQYEHINKGMALDEFQFIYWWEWAHRFLGRFIGIAFALPFAWFWMRGQLSRRTTLKLAGVFALGGLQGGIGWFMVMSGLVDRVDVSPYRLALHLVVALAILAAVVWLVLDLRRSNGDPLRLRTITPGQKRLAVMLLSLVLLQSLLGAFVAGNNAGLTYNTWPLMDGALVPDGLWTLSPWYLNAFENVTAVQFNHRMVAYVLAGLAVVHSIWLARSADDERLVRSAVVLTVGIFAQAALGIWTLLAVVPLWLGLAHQAGAAVVLILAVWHAHGMLHAPAARERVAGGYAARPSIS